MMKKTIAIALLLAAACSKQSAAPPANEAEPAANATTLVENEAPLNPPAPGEPGGLPDDRTPISEGAIDPKSGQGAGQVLQSYFALSESGRFAEANKLWSVGVERLDLTDYREVHANIGAPGQIEGGAGSLYVEVPVQLYGRMKDGKEFNSLGTMTLRRVNDVPGSTEEQRRWHIMNAEFVNAN
jgi:hypothetical protein